MIVVDSSALVSIVLGEEDAERLLMATTSQRAAVSAASLVETTLVVEARQWPGGDSGRDVIPPH